MKWVWLLVLSVLAFSDSFRLTDVSDNNDGQGEDDVASANEDEKRIQDSSPLHQIGDRQDVICSTTEVVKDDKDCHSFYLCTQDASTGGFQLYHCTCYKGHIFGGDLLHLCEIGTCENPLRDGSAVSLMRVVSADRNYVCREVEETTKETPTTSEITGTTEEYTTMTGEYTTTTQEQTQTTAETVTTVAPFECQTLGAFPDPRDCYSYYQCTGNSSGYLTWEHEKCPDGQYFNADDSMCEIGFCFWTSPTPPPTFECTSLGEFPDPDDCHSYFICQGTSDGSIILIKGKCDEGMYFNNSMCVYGDC